MNFETGHLFHIYNQGNNRQLIFFDRENYLFFLRKMELYVLPYADILAYCLMPNHFHIMVHVNHTELPRRHAIIGVTPHRQSLASHPDNAKAGQRSFNDSIGIMLRSYTRAVNKQVKRTGALFREETKAVCLTRNNGVAPAWFCKNGFTQINIVPPERQYPNTCFNYILFNPVKSGLVKSPGDWEFSSYAITYTDKKSNLINKARIEEFGLQILPENDWLTGDFPANSNGQS